MRRKPKTPLSESYPDIEVFRIPAYWLINHPEQEILGTSPTPLNVISFAEDTLALPD